MRKLIFTALLVSVMAGCGQQPKTFDELCRAGEEAFAAQKYAKARKYLTQAVAQKSSDRHLLYLLGISYRRDFMYDSAFYYLKRLDLLYPGDREVNQELYTIAKTIREWKSALKAINVLVETGDSAEQYWEELADFNIKIENYTVAYYFSRKLLEKEPDNPNYYLQVANLASQIDSVDVALAVIDSALERFGQKNEFLVNKGLYLATIRHYQESETLFRSLLTKDTSSVTIRLNLANTLASQDDPAKKREALQLYLRLRPATDDIFRVDSLIEVLQEELGIID